MIWFNPDFGFEIKCLLKMSFLVPFDGLNIVFGHVAAEQYC